MTKLLKLVNPCQTTLTLSTLADGTSSVGLTVGVGSARVVVARIQGAAETFRPHVKYRVRV